MPNTAAQADTARLFAAAQDCLQASRLAEAEALYRQILRREPDHPDALHGLGLVAFAVGQNEAAIELLVRAVTLSGSEPSFHGNLGVALERAGRLEEAVTAYRKAVSLQPRYAQALRNLGNALKGLGRLDEAMASFRNAVACDPGAAEAHNNLGIILRDRGQAEEAIDCYRRAIAAKPEHANAHYNLGNALLDLGDIEGALASYAEVLRLRPDDAGLSAAVLAAVLYYLRGDSVACREMLRPAAPIRLRTEDEYLDLAVYHHYLEVLLAQARSESLGPEDVLHVVGESHALAAHGSVVRHGTGRMRCKAYWVSGCKQWHLANGAKNQYKKAFEVILGQLPHGSTVLLTIGEIDCRPDEGILRAWRKTPERPIGALIDELVAGYVKYVRSVASRHQHRLIVCGVPATNLDLGALSADSVEQFVGLLRAFNQALRVAANDAGMGFLDVYGLTDRGDGVSNGVWHIDTHHLSPRATEQAFERYLIPGFGLG